MQGFGPKAEGLDAYVYPGSGATADNRGLGMNSTDGEQVLNMKRSDANVSVVLHWKATAIFSQIWLYNSLAFILPTQVCLRTQKPSLCRPVRL